MFRYQQFVKPQDQKIHSYRSKDLFIDVYFLYVDYIYSEVYFIQIFCILLILKLWMLSMFLCVSKI